MGIEIKKKMRRKHFNLYKSKETFNTKLDGYQAWTTNWNPADPCWEQLNQKQSLTKDLALAQRLAEIRKVPYLPTQNWDSLKYALYSLFAVGFTLWMTQTWTPPKNPDG